MFGIYAHGVNPFSEVRPPIPYALLLGIVVLLPPLVSSMRTFFSLRSVADDFLIVSNHLLNWVTGRLRIERQFSLTFLVDGTHVTHRRATELPSDAVLPAVVNMFALRVMSPSYFST